MHKKNISNLFLILSFFFTTTVIAQNTHEINLSITDSVIIRKQVKKNYKYAIKVNAEINVKNLQDSIFLYSFNKYVSSTYVINDLHPDRYKKHSTGLLYVIEDKNNNIIAPPMPTLPDTEAKNIIKRMHECIFVTPKLKIKRRLLSTEELRDYVLKKYVINSSNQSLELYPLLGEYHYDLPKGEYYLYLAYSFQPSWQHVYKEIVNDPRTFKGWVVSNKVKLIVK